ncbi:hypothetical protein BO94DRAFT_343806 [Aspergillus sclerotioniger CBS 115572]|uniref:Uncharacterized protein n=1 Tax=Aspergillus sclerotioniger CBS 115572 TaxID=1450535 RepID=A0A317X761_9EURO|nr:hypothetical protein BO94DRAFT_343806 [Aspergillus sclerotioniger CBS 115572]PWY93472.1 hypothetical protein BO94DRAFT_343806 [Aspergillus sclerotioniger CBS 115572]
MTTASTPFFSSSAGKHLLRSTPPRHGGFPRDSVPRSLPFRPTKQWERRKATQGPIQASPTNYLPNHLPPEHRHSLRAIYIETTGQPRTGQRNSSSMACPGSCHPRSSDRQATQPCRPPMLFKLSPASGWARYGFRSILFLLFLSL